MSEDLELTDEERKAVAALKRVAKRWPSSLWLFSASGSLLVMRYGPDGNPVHRENGTVDPELEVAQIDIPNDGGDF